MLTRIALGNFKIFSNVEVEPKQITVLTGPNGSGKSTIVQALMLLKQSHGAPQLKLDGPYVNMGSDTDIAHSPSELISIGFSGEEVVKNQEFLDDGCSEEVSFEIEAGFSGGQLVNLRSEMFLGEELGYVEGEFRDKKRVGSKGEVSWEKGRIFIESQLDLYHPFRTTDSSGISTAWENDRGLRYTGYMCAAPKRMFESMELIPSNRGFSLPAYSLGDEPISHFETTKPRYEYEADMATTMAYHRDKLEPKVSDWMSKITGIKVRFPMGRKKTGADFGQAS